jgi:repressor LexA
VGAIQAGFPILAFEEAEKEDLRDLLPLGGDLFALRVKGQSMVEDHIQDGDLVVVARTAGADPGDLVVALVDGEEATLKRFYPEGARVRLEPANATFEPIVLPRERVRIQGRVVGVLRLYR